MILQHRQEQPITYHVHAEPVKNGVQQFSLYSLVPTSFGSQPARNFICEGSKEYCLEVLNKLVESSDFLRVSCSPLPNTNEI
jgi:hypothetical protein